LQCAWAKDVSEIKTDDIVINGSVAVSADPRHLVGLILDNSNTVAHVVGVDKDIVKYCQAGWSVLRLNRSVVTVADGDSCSCRLTTCSIRFKFERMNIYQSRTMKFQIDP
jgi:hypothetical protein